MASIPYIATATGEASAAPDGAIPIDLYGASSGGEATAWGDITGKPAVIGAGESQAAARAAIGAGTGNGTSSLAVATTAPAPLAAAASVGTGTTAARADHVHALPTAAQIGAAATSHNQAATTVTVAASSGIVGANVQAVLADLAARIVALEAV